MSLSSRAWPREAEPKTRILFAPFRRAVSRDGLSLGLQTSQVSSHALTSYLGMPRHALDFTKGHALGGSVIRSAPKNTGGVIVDLPQHRQQIRGRLEQVVVMPAAVAVAPVERPLRFLVPDCATVNRLHSGGSSGLQGGLRSTIVTELPRISYSILILSRTCGGTRSSQ
jgi:hypothetical protein